MVSFNSSKKRMKQFIHIILRQKKWILLFDFWKNHELVKNVATLSDLYCISYFVEWDSIWETYEKLFLVGIRPWEKKSWIALLFYEVKNLLVFSLRRSFVFWKTTEWILKDFHHYFIGHFRYIYHLFPLLKLLHFTGG